MAFECRSKTQVHGQNDFSQCKMGDPRFQLKLIKFSLGKYWEVFLEHSYVLGMVTFHTSLAVGLIIIYNLLWGNQLSCVLGKLFKNYK